MILIVNTTEDRELSRKIGEWAEGNGKEYEIVEASGMNISNCIGCNQCWLKTPGVCCIQDDYEIILKKLVKADQFWIISDTSFGFLDHKGKNIFDRIVPLLLMYLEFRGKQMKHILRYDKRTDIGIIYRGEGDREYLNRWNERVTQNLDSNPLGAFPAAEWKEAASCMQ